MLNAVGVEDPLHCEVSSSSLGELQVNEGTSYITWSKKYRNNKLLTEEFHDFYWSFATVLSAALIVFGPLWWNHTSSYESVPSVRWVVVCFTVFYSISDTVDWTQMKVRAKWCIALLCCSTIKISLISPMCCFIGGICPCVWWNIGDDA